MSHTVALGDMFHHYHEQFILTQPNIDPLAADENSTQEIHYFLLFA